MSLNSIQCFLIIIIIIISLIFFYLLISQISEKYKEDDPMLKNIKSSLEKLHPVVKDIKFLKGDKSYTINKKKIYLCLKNEKQQYYGKNMLMYVSIHELAHVLCDEIGHTDKFYQIFDNLLDKAAKIGIYNPSIPVEENYCEY